MKAIKFTKAASEKLKHTDHTYRVQDDQTVGLSIEVRAAPSILKIFMLSGATSLSIRMVNKKDGAVEGRFAGMARNQLK